MGLSEGIIDSYLTSLIDFIFFPGKFDTFHRADLRISDIGNLLGPDWVQVAHQLDIDDSDINIIKSEYPDNEGNWRDFFRVMGLGWFPQFLPCFYGVKKD